MEEIRTAANEAAEAAAETEQNEKKPETAAEKGDGKNRKEKKTSGKKKRRIVRRLVTLAVILALLGLGGYIVVRKLQADYRVVYTPYTASVGSISNSLSYSGSMQLINSAAYTAPSDSKVREVYVTVGQAVKEGDKLIRLSDGTTLSAEFDGTVNSVGAEKGDEVKAGDSLVQVADFGRMKVSFRVGESDIRDVAPGQGVRITVASVGAVFEAEIDTIDYVSYSGNNVAYYTATALVDTSATAGIYPGMQATVTIPQEEATDVVILKMDAISTSADNSAFVYIQAEDGTMTAQPVTVGVSNGNYVEIRSGVSEGQTVYVIEEQEEETVGGILAGLFGTQQVNPPSGGMPGSGSDRGGFQMPSDGSFPSGDRSPGSGGGRDRGD